MEDMSLCNERFFYEFMDKSCAKEIDMPKKGEKCHSFMPRITITLYDEVNDEKDEKVPLYKEIE